MHIKFQKTPGDEYKSPEMTKEEAFEHWEMVVEDKSLETLMDMSTQEIQTLFYNNHIVPI